MKEKILILGGTEFVGRLLVEKLQSDTGKELYLFNRGKTNPDLFPEVKRIIGDRESSDIEKIKSMKWDFVVDFSSYYPASLQKTLKQLTKDVKRYIYISTISVYDFEGYDSSFAIGEDYKKVGCSAAEAVDKTMKTYGKKKAACEAVLKENDWLPAVILRPSVIYGKYDPTDRFYYWLRKLKMNERMVIPNEGKDVLTLTYADDLVQIILNALDGFLPPGTYNCSTHEPISFDRLLSMMKDFLESKCAFTGIEVSKLKAKNVWLPLSFIGNLIIDNKKITDASNIEFTRFEASVKAVIDFYHAKGWPACRVGMADEKERMILNEFS